MPVIFINYTVYYWRLGHSPTGQYGRFHRIGRTATNAKCTPHRRWVVRPLQGQLASTTVAEYVELWNFHSQEPGAKVPWNFRSMEQNYPGTFTPKMAKTTTYTCYYVVPWMTELS